MCVKQTRESGIVDGDLLLPTFEKLKPAFPDLEALILNGVGEPLLNPHLEEFIRRAKRDLPESCWVGFQSNALLLTSQKALDLVRAGLDRICLSLDAVSPETFRRVREGAELSCVENAMVALAKAKRETTHSRLQMGVEFVLMRDNITELPAAIRWAAERGATFALVTHLLPYDDSHTAQAAYEICTDASIELFEKWQMKGRSSGIDLMRYFDVVWRYTKTDEDRRLVQFANEMKAEAEILGISLNLKNLIGLDRQWLETLAEIFAQSRSVAENKGIELQLPEIVPREDRLCHFVEDGSAFISWNGDVHPCYFLWHRYNCFASGWDQKVKPKVFGNLSDSGILEIWNRADFRTFRASVLDYNYPYCASCSLAPCDYVQTEEFEHDCHIKEEPCGSCLWCMGLFQCLR
jgi:putative metalloenzyme radical SAM/SPASM domain maturase